MKSHQRETVEGIQAVSETIRICKDQDILGEYLATREKEVITMMMDLYDQDRIMEIHIASEKKIAAKKAAEKATKEATQKAIQEAREKEEASIKRMLCDGMIPAEKIVSYVGVSVEKVREVEARMLQEA